MSKRSVQTLHGMLSVLVGFVWSKKTFRGQEITFFIQNQEEWTRQCIYNIAASGKFSSDRTITDYATEIWGAEPQPGYRIPGPTDARPGTE